MSSVDICTDELEYIQPLVLNEVFSLVQLVPSLPLVLDPALSHTVGVCGFGGLAARLRRYHTQSAGVTEIARVFTFASSFVHM